MSTLALALDSFGDWFALLLIIVGAVFVLVVLAYAVMFLFWMAFGEDNLLAAIIIYAVPVLGFAYGLWWAWGRLFG